MSNYDEALHRYGSFLLDGSRDNNAQGGGTNPDYVAQGLEALQRRRKLARVLLEHRKIPEEGWDDATIEWFIKDLSMLDSNNFIGNALVNAKLESLARSCERDISILAMGLEGDVSAVQPKAAGSSIINKLTTALVKDLFWSVLGMKNLKGFLVVPMATGMAITLALLGIRRTQPTAGRYVLWPRIDQKTCLKAIVAAGFEPVVVETAVDGDNVRTDLEDLKRKLVKLGREAVACVISTTSCFAPRIPDDVEAIAKLCQELGDVPHIINNAYGLQCSKCCHQVNMACKKGRVDAVVQSTDKNLMVPVGGAIIAGPVKSWIESDLSKTYPGRASISPILDVLLTLLSLGKTRFAEIRKRRINLVDYFKREMSRVAEKHNERLLLCNNKISFGVTLSCLEDRLESEITRFGSMLFTRGVSGARVVAKHKSQSVAGHEFAGYGASNSSYPHNYFTIACAIGIRKEDIDLLAKRVDRAMSDALESRKPNATPNHTTGAQAQDEPPVP